MHQVCLVCLKKLGLPWTPPLLTFPVHCFMQVMGSKMVRLIPSWQLSAEIPREFPEISEAKSMRGFEPPTSQNLPLLQPRWSNPELCWRLLKLQDAPPNFQKHGKNMKKTMTMTSLTVLYLCLIMFRQSHSNDSHPFKCDHKEINWIQLLHPHHEWWMMMDDALQNRASIIDNSLTYWVSQMVNRCQPGIPSSN